MKILLTSAACCLALSTQAQAKSRYELRVRLVKEKRVGYTNERSAVSLVDRVRRRLVWTRQMDARHPEVTWSRDRRALVVEDSYRFWVWREGYRLRRLAAPRGSDYTMGCVWSPDNRRLLIRLGGSGEGDMDLGSLHCLKLGRWPHYKYFHLPFEGEGIRRFGWKSRKVAWFQAVDIDAIKGHTLRPRRLWHAP